MLVVDLALARVVDLADDDHRTAAVDQLRAGLVVRDAGGRGALGGLSRFGVKAIHVSRNENPWRAQERCNKINHESTETLTETFSALKLRN